MKLQILHSHRPHNKEDKSFGKPEEIEQFFLWARSLSTEEKDELCAQIRAKGYHGPLSWELRDAHPRDLYIIALARKHGWQPHHLRLVMECGYGAGGFILGGFILQRRDLVSMAEALRLALPEIPDEDQLKDDRKVVEMNGFHFVRIIHPEDHQLFDYFSGDNKEWLKSFIVRITQAAQTMMDEKVPYGRMIGNKYADPVGSSL